MLPRQVHVQRQQELGGGLIRICGSVHGAKRIVKCRPALTVSPLTVCAVKWGLVLCMA